MNQTQYYCENGTSGSVTLNTITITQFSTVWGEVYIDYNDGYEKIKVKTDIQYLGLDDLARQQRGKLIVFFVLIIICAITFIYNPKMGLVAFGLGTLLIAFTKFTLITVPWAIGVICLCVLALVTMSKNENK